MLRRVCRIPVASIAEAARALPEVTHIIVDVDGTLLPFTGDRGVKAVEDALRRLISAWRPHSVYVVTNVRTNLALEPAYDAVPVTLVTHAKKPWTSADLLGRPCDGSTRPCLRAVLGDQVLTDGLLAVRLGIPFLHISPPAFTVPLWPRMMGIVSRPLVPLLFSGRRPWRG